MLVVLRAELHQCAHTPSRSLCSSEPQGPHLQNGVCSPGAWALSHSHGWWVMRQDSPGALFVLKGRRFGEESGFSGGSDGKEPTCNAGDPGSISGLGRSPGEGNGHPLQYSGLENPIDRGAQWATVHEVGKSWTQLSDEHFGRSP